MTIVNEPSRRPSVATRAMNALVREETDKSLSGVRLAFYASPAVALSAMGLPKTLFLPVMYAQDLGVGLTAVGVVFMLTRFWDIFTDPVLGLASDRFPTRLGRRRHWMIIAAPILVISVFMLFMPHYVIGEQATPAYLLFWLIVLYVGYTLATLSHTAWGAELSTDYHERSRIQGWREGIHLVGMLTVMAAPAFYELTQDNVTSGDRLEVMGWYVIILLPLLTILAVTSVGERKGVPVERLDYKKALKILVTNTLLLRIVIADVLIASQFAITGALYVFFVEHILQADEATFVLFFYFGASIVAVPLWLRISKYTGKHKAVALAMAGFGLTCLGFFLPGPGDIWLFAFFVGLSGLVFGGAGFLLRAIMADITDYDQAHTGEQRTGLYYALLAMTAKVGPAVAVGVTYPLIEFLGFDPASGAVTQHGLSVLRYTFVFLPVVPCALAGLLVYFFPLNEAAQKELRRTIEAAEKASPTI